MAKYRKKPVVIEAFPWALHAPVSAVPNWYFEACGAQVCWPEQDGTLTIKTLEGNMKAQPGDMVIQGVNGALYPCKPDIFAATYEPASANPAVEPASAQGEEP